jgi:hypothetical protein
VSLLSGATKDLIFLADLAAELKTLSLSEAYEIRAVHSPIQKDGDNCGLFICLFVWHRFFKEAATAELQRRRWDVLRTVVEEDSDVK